MPPTGGHFGNAAFELAGIIVHSNLQGQGIGTEMVRQFAQAEEAKRMIAYTRNPSVLRVLGEVSNTKDVLAHADPATRRYNGEILRERCVLLSDPNHALALTVNLDGASHE